jgi:hypothetical protein
MSALSLSPVEAASLAGAKKSLGSNFGESEARRSASVAHDELLLQYMSQE